MDKVIAAFLGMLLSFHVSAAVVPVTPMQNAVSGVIQKKMAQRGFAANDPRWHDTLVASSGQVAGIAASAAVITLAGVTAPAWITVAGSILVGTVVTLAVDGLVEWAFGDPASPTPITVTGNVSGQPDPVAPLFAPMVAGGEYWNTFGAWKGGSPDAAFYAYFRDPDQGMCGGGACPPKAQGSYSEFKAEEYAVTATSKTYKIYSRSVYGDGSASAWFNSNTVTPGYNASGAPADCAAGQAYVSSCVGIPLKGTQVSNDGAQTVQQAVDTLTPEEKAKPLNPQIIADLANKAMQQAAALPDYSGVPVPLNDPITASDVQAWRADNTASYPTVGDALSPQPLANSPYSLLSGPPQAQQDPAIDPNPVVNPASSSPQVNLGADPGIGAPGLEQIPTAAQILAPLLGMFPDFRGYVVPDHTAVCPAPSGELFGTAFVLDGHCNLLDGVRPSLHLLMAAVWLMVSTFVVLRA